MVVAFCDFFHFSGVTNKFLPHRLGGPDHPEMTLCCGCCHLSGWLLAGGLSRDLAESHSPHMRLSAGSSYEAGDTQKGPQQATVGQKGMTRGIFG